MLMAMSTVTSVFERRLTLRTVPRWPRHTPAMTFTRSSTRRFTTALSFSSLSLQIWFTAFWAIRSSAASRDLTAVGLNSSAFAFAFSAAAWASARSRAFPFATTVPPSGVTTRHRAPRRTHSSAAAAQPPRSSAICRVGFVTLILMWWPVTTG
jgi:hypothetical protein